jgi:hypothetical protein
MRYRVWLCIVAAILSSVSCAAQQDLVIQMRLTKAKVLLGEPVWVDVTVTNRGATPLRIDMGTNCFGNRLLKAEIPNAAPGIPQKERRCYRVLVGAVYPPGLLYWSQAIRSAGATSWRVISISPIPAIIRFCWRRRLRMQLPLLGKSHAAVAQADRPDQLGALGRT